MKSMVLLMVVLDIMRVFFQGVFKHALSKRI